MEQRKDLKGAFDQMKGPTLPVNSFYFFFCRTGDFMVL